MRSMEKQAEDDMIRHKASAAEKLPQRRIVLIWPPCTPSSQETEPPTPSDRFLSELIGNR
jgi:hypothetical protein